MGKTLKKFQETFGKVFGTILFILSFPIGRSLKIGKLEIGVSGKPIDSGDFK